MWAIDSWAKKKVKKEKPRCRDRWVSDASISPVVLLLLALAWTETLYATKERRDEIYHSPMPALAVVRWPMMTTNPNKTAAVSLWNKAIANQPLQSSLSSSFFFWLDSPVRLRQVNWSRSTTHLPVFSFWSSQIKKGEKNTGEYLYIDSSPLVTF